MTHDDLEERMRQAIAADPLEPGASVWAEVARQRAADEGRIRRRWPRYVVAGLGIAAGVGGLLLFNQKPPADGTGPSARALPQRDSERESFFSPAALLAQSPAFPLVTGDGPRGLRLRAGSWKYIYVKNGTDTLPSNLTYTIHRGTVNGVAAWSLVSDNSHPKAWRNLDSLWVSADSLRPLMRITNPGNVRLEQTFRKDDVLSGYFSPSGYVNWKTTVLSDTTRFNEASIVRWEDMATFFQTSTITAEWKRSIPMSAAAEFGAIRPAWMNLAAMGEERVTTPAGVFDCWKLRLGILPDPSSGYEFRTEDGVVKESDYGIYFWVSKDKGWLVQQGVDNRAKGTTSRSILVEGHEE
jgi:hypothetical protein